MATTAHRATADSRRIIGESGTIGLRPILERCYRRVAATRDQKVGAYCIMLDRAATVTTVKLFPQIEDPFFNLKSFGQRALEAVQVSVRPASYKVNFTKNLVQVEDAESDLAGYKAGFGVAGQAAPQ